MSVQQSNKPSELSPLFTIQQSVTSPAHDLDIRISAALEQESVSAAFGDSDGLFLSDTDSDIQSESQNINVLDLIIKKAQNTSQWNISEGTQETDSEIENYKYYLVTELHRISLKQFCTNAQTHIKNGKLNHRAYLRLLKRIFFQISSAINWLHSEMKCCLLNLSIGNIMLENADFVSHSNNSVSVSSNMTVKFTDFSNAEIFKGSDFKCAKFDYLQQTQTEMCYFSPKRVNENLYNARAADMWTVGMILYECVIGTPIYTSEDVSVLYNGHWAVYSGKIPQYLAMNAAMTKMNRRILSVINRLLQVNEEQRMSADQLLRSKWMSGLYQTRFN